MFDVNVFALIMVVQASLPMLIEVKGVVINKSPLAGCPS
jgi:NADP-dependent 3-hydroxy acid dehydrogenase YdfG